MDYYNTLGVPKTATQEEIKSAYRKLASKCHPDKGGDTATFQKIQAAYDVLGDAEKRNEFDNPTPKVYGHFRQQHDSDIHAFMRAMMARHRQIYQTTILVNLHDVYFGGVQTVEVQTNTSSPTVSIAIPKGVPNGHKVRLDNVIPSATLLVEFRVQPHLIYTRSGDDLVSTHPVSVLDLIVGTSFEFDTLSGKTLAVTIPPNTQPYHQMKISGHGLPIMGTSGHGSQILTLKSFVPTDIPQEIIDSIKKYQTV